MAKVTFDTNIFISRPRVELPSNFYLSAVVLQELVVGAEDEAEVKSLDAARREYEKAGRLLVPTGEAGYFGCALSSKVVVTCMRASRPQN